MNADVAICLRKDRFLILILQPYLNYARDYGLLFPKDIDFAIDTLLKASYFDSHWDESSLRDLVCYYLFYPSIVAQQYESDAYGFYPFCHFVESLHKMNIGKYGDNLQILHAGCGCEETALCGYKMVENLFGTENLASFEVIDICSIPVKRIRKFNELSRFVPQGIKFEAKMQDIGRMVPETSYDVIITDRLISTSPQKEYCLRIVNSFRKLIKDDGIVITTVDAESGEALSETPQLSGEICYDYFCHRYGKTDNGRDAKIGLTKQQWDEFTSRYFQEGDVKYSSDNFSWFLRSVNDIVNLFHDGGFSRLKIKRLCLKSGISYEDVDLNGKNLGNVEGSFIVCAMK